MRAAAQQLRPVGTKPSGQPVELGNKVIVELKGRLTRTRGTGDVITLALSAAASTMTRAWI